MKVTTTQYQFSHGSKPRGYGEWFFYTPTTWKTDLDNMRLVSWGTGTFTAIKNLAIAEAKEQGITELIVGT